MVKVKVLSRNEEDFTRERNSDPIKIFRNFDPKLHPFQKAREYTRALNAVKWDKVFAKPFLFALDSHRDAICSMTRLPNSLVYHFSGACDGELKLWNLSSQANVWSVQAHSRFVRGICPDQTGDHVFTCSDDSTVKLWKVDASDFLAADKPISPVATFMGENAFSGISHHRKENQFATSGVRVDIWDSTRSQPLHSFAWGADSIYTVKYSPVEVDLLASSSSDCNIVLYDVRNRTPLKKVVMNMSTNAICWNPMEAFNFTIANEDHNCYTYDMRKLDHILNVHEDHVAAVMTLDYSPSGKEFCSGSYDRSIRIFDANEGHSREIYHSKRMQRIFSVSCSADNKYVLSGSDDTNVRVWKLQASERLSALLPRQRNTANYRKKLKEKYQHAPEIRKIAKHRLTPKAITSQRKLKDTIKKAKGEKVKRKRAHTKPGAEPFESVKTKKIRRVEV